MPKTKYSQKPASEIVPESKILELVKDYRVGKRTLLSLRKKHLTEGVHWFKGESPRAPVFYAKDETVQKIKHLRMGIAV